MIDADRSTPADRSMIARLAAHISHANDADPTARTAPARAAANEKFVKQAREMHPDASDERIAQVAEHLRKAHFIRLGRASGAARRAKAKTAKAPAA
ncbi:hypothetical protein [Streptomyces sp. MI02-7b]|uniref:hypothetical protein n=1 Tax=Streptomyces sp. MI02-7b TaxID=462941 RepID=UPI0029B42687|nr:hypothetical protein [Streptomyces sp. MI02-7b]MDX3074579.1 hypothetical protein [Streptomyces sp. MI02-7b]